MPYRTRLIEATFADGETTATYVEYEIDADGTKGRTIKAARSWFDLGPAAMIGVAVPSSVEGTITTLKLQACALPGADSPSWLDVLDADEALISIAVGSGTKGTMVVVSADIAPAPALRLVFTADTNPVAPGDGADVTVQIVIKG